MLGKGKGVDFLIFFGFHIPIISFFHLPTLYKARPHSPSRVTVHSLSSSSHIIIKFSKKKKSRSSLPLMMKMKKPFASLQRVFIYFGSGSEKNPSQRLLPRPHETRNPPPPPHLELVSSTSSHSTSTHHHPRPRPRPRPRPSQPTFPSNEIHNQEKTIGKKPPS